MSGSEDLLPLDSHLDLPQPVKAALLDMGLACVAAELALAQARLLERQATAAAERADVSGPEAFYQRQYAGDLVDSAIGYADRLTVAYTMASATYASYAATVGAEAGAGRRLGAADPVSVLPSQILGQPQRYVPLIQLAPHNDVETELIDDHNQQLAEDHRSLHDVMAGVLEAGPATVYDDPSQSAHRPAGSVSLITQLPEALHRYATTCVSAIGLATRQRRDGQA
ncbi:hypothetical protein Pme01_21850 [Planosporangium mesophilum]|uniref:Uncharacterized protein n=2 Tax=Planosporangium mesophilum TaxID=689768 RepID=A0A8J3T9B3_9ACTN|nr:hypothetical protein Pme01_21850 [Planosporangium mesophilum]